jgi:hypothetical protein
LAGGCDLSGTDSPDGFVGNDNVGPVLRLENVGDGLQLTEDDRSGLVGFTLLELFTNASDDLEAVGKGEGNLLGDNLVMIACQT